jgi:hypothetical protein
VKFEKEKKCRSKSSAERNSLWWNVKSGMRKCCVGWSCRFLVASK